MHTCSVGLGPEARTHPGQVDLDVHLHYPAASPLRPHVTGRDLSARALATMHLYARRNPHAEAISSS